MNRDKMKIGIITASKNPLSHYGESIIKQCFNSLITQTYQNWHLYLANYGDRKETEEISKFLPNDKVTIVETEISENQNNFTNALNSSLRAATEEVVARQDLDDWSYPERFEKQISFFNQNANVYLVGTMAHIFGGNKTLTPLKKPEPIWNHLDILNHVRQCNPFVHGSVMFRRVPILQDVGFYDNTYTTAQDFDYWCRIISKFPVANLKDYLYVWRDFKNSISNKNPGAGPKNKGIAIRKWGKDIDKKLNELKNKNL